LRLDGTACARALAVLFILAFLFTQLPTVSAGGYQTDYVQYVIVENSTFIEGTIVDNETGSLVGGAGVGGEIHSDVIYVNVQADANGRFRIVLPSGEDHTYVLNITAPGYDNRMITGSIKSGERKNLGQIRINYNPFDIVLAETSGSLSRYTDEAWGTKTTTVTATQRNNYQGDVNLSLVYVSSGVSASVDSSILKFSSSANTTLRMTPKHASSHTIVVRAYDSNGRLVRTPSYNLNTSEFSRPSYTPPARDFTISVSPTSGTIYVGESTSATVSVTPINGYPYTVSLRILTEKQCFSIGSWTLQPSGSTTLNISCSIVGTWTTTVTGVGADGKSRSATHTLTVKEKPPTPTSAIKLPDGGGQVYDGGSCSGSFGSSGGGPMNVLSTVNPNNPSTGYLYSSVTFQVGEVSITATNNQPSITDKIASGAKRVVSAVLSAIQLLVNAVRNLLSGLFK